MKKSFLLSAASILLSALFAVTSSADVTSRDDSPDAYEIIDDMSTSDAWSPLEAGTMPSTSISSAMYSESSGSSPLYDKDIGYSVVKDQTASDSVPVTVTRSFSEPLNLYKYGSIAFDCNISAPPFTPASEDAPVGYPSFFIEVTLHSGDDSISYKKIVSTSSWEHITVPVYRWNRRTQITSIDISVTVSVSRANDFPLVYRIDNLIACDPMQSPLEDTFMTSSFASAGGSISYYDDTNSFLWSKNAGTSTISASAVIKDPASSSEHNTLRAVISSDSDVTLSVLATYTDGTGYIGPETQIRSGNSATAVYFKLPSAAKIDKFTIMASSDDVCNIRIIGLSSLRTPIAASPGIGEITSCLSTEDGINIKGNLPSEDVVDHLNGKILVFASVIGDPAYSEAPLAEADMTTRFNITIPKGSLPDGYQAMMYTVMIADGDEIIPVSTPRIPSPSGTGTPIPAVSVGKKGLASPYLSPRDRAALTEITVDLADLIGDAVSGRIFTYRSHIFYFNTDYLKYIDKSVHSLSASGDVYLRLVCSSPELLYPEYSITGGGFLLRADDEDTFSLISAAVDFLASRFSSDEYGYIRGIIAGHTDDVYPGVDHAAYAESLFSALSAIYCSGSVHIDDFRVLLPLEYNILSPELVGGRGDTELLLRFITALSDSYGIGHFGFAIDADASGIDSIDDILSCAEELSPLKSTVIATASLGENITTADQMISEYLRLYYALATSEHVDGFILDISSFENEAEMSQFLEYFAVADTDRHAASHDFAGSPILYPVASSVIIASYEIPDHLGSFALFDYTGAFDTGGWFSVSDGKCLSVKDGQHRAMLASGSGGVMFSSPSSPIDLSASPTLVISAYASSPSDFTLMIMSDASVFSSDFTVSGDTDAVFDLSDFTGVGNITCILLIPRTDVSELLIRSICSVSTEYDDDALKELHFTSSEGGASGTPPEKNTVAIMAVVIFAAVMSAAAVSLLRRKNT